jgi:hypothetical protein
VSSPTAPRVVPGEAEDDQVLHSPRGWHDLHIELSSLRRIATRTWRYRCGFLLAQYL